ncbi:MAG: hypothetical protein O9264_14210 [Leptospira sp.]|nr:hypothetical protein [Leptospira sp.]
MVDKILSTSSSKYIYLAALFVIAGMFFHCQSSISWIRELPNPESISVQINSLKEGTYIRPTNNRAPMNSTSHTLNYREWIVLEKDKSFTKTMQSIAEYPLSNSAEVIVGKGTYKHVGPWVLLSTSILFTKSCQYAKVDQKEKVKANQNRHEPCSETPFISKESNHRLLYHFDSVSQSLAPLQFESGYKEADFGIGWEVKTPYAEDALFKKIRAKYTKKEFQPHVYTYERLD